MEALVKLENVQNLSIRLAHIKKRCEFIFQFISYEKDRKTVKISSPKFLDPITYIVVSR